MGGFRKHHTASKGGARVIDSGYADNYHNISYHDNLSLSYRIDSRYCVFKIIVSHQILIIHFEDYRIISNFDNSLWRLSYRIEFWSFILKIIISYRILIFSYWNYRIVSNLIIKVWNYRYHIKVEIYLSAFTDINRPITITILS